MLPFDIKTLNLPYCPTSPLLQIQHPRSQLNRFNLVITPRHDYYPLTPQGQAQIPWFLRRWITPREPPDRHVVCVSAGKYICIVVVTPLKKLGCK